MGQSSSRRYKHKILSNATAVPLTHEELKKFAKRKKKKNPQLVIASQGKTVYITKKETSESYTNSAAEDPSVTATDEDSDERLFDLDTSLDTREKPYKIISVRDLEAMQLHVTERLAEFLALPLPFATVLLLHFRWNLEEAIEQYRLDPEAVCLAAGLLVPSCHEILDPLDAELRKRPANREKSSPASEPGAAAKGAGSTISETEMSQTPLRPRFASGSSSSFANESGRQEPINPFSETEMAQRELSESKADTVSGTHPQPDLVLRRGDDDSSEPSQPMPRESAPIPAAHTVKREISDDSTTGSSIAPKHPSHADFSCGICYTAVKPEATFCLACQHRFCVECWRTHLRVKIQEGVTCLFARCMSNRCHVVVDPSAWRKLASPDDYAKYQRFLLRSFVERNQRMCWCPNPRSCDYAIELNEPVGAKCVVECLCGFRFCWKCRTAEHIPVTCEQKREWEEVCEKFKKVEGAQWVVVNAKPCPKWYCPCECRRHRDTDEQRNVLSTAGP